MFVHILEPQPSRDRWQYWVVVFADQGLPEVRETHLHLEAEDFQLQVGIVQEWRSLLAVLGLNQCFQQVLKTAFQSFAKVEPMLPWETGCVVATT